MWCTVGWFTAVKTCSFERVCVQHLEFTRYWGAFNLSVENLGLLEMKVQQVTFNCSVVFYTSQLFAWFLCFCTFFFLWPTAGDGKGRSSFGSFPTVVRKREAVQGWVPVLMQAEGQWNVCLSYISFSWIAHELSGTKLNERRCCWRYCWQLNWSGFCLQAIGLLHLQDR